MKVNKRRILIALIFVLVAMQFIQPEKTNPASAPSSDIAAVLSLNEADVALMKKACYDCHSNETVWPGYSNVAPISYFVVHHVNEGRHHLNFSEWASYDAGKADHKLEECAEEVEEGEMPMSSYVLMHSEAGLNAEERAHLVELFQSLRK